MTCGLSEIAVSAEHLAGVWANWFRVTYTEHELTIDFARIDPVAPRGVVVARVSASPLLVMRLVDNLQAVWHDWAAGAMPKEVHDPDEGRAPDDEDTRA